MAGDGATKDNAKTVLVRQGDYLAKLAYAHDLDPEDIWNDPANAELTTLRLDPNLLAPGDRIYIPVKPRAALPIQKGTTNRYTATIPRVPVTIRFGAEDGRFAKTPFVIHGAATSPDRATDDKGTVTVSVPVHATSFDVELPELGKRFTVLVGYLDPVSTPAGVRARMVQLGYFLPPTSNAMNFDAGEKVEFDDALAELTTEFEAVRKLPKSPDHLARVDRAHQKLESIVKSKGSPQAGRWFSARMMVVNILCLIAVWMTMPDDPNAWKWQDYANLGSTVASTGLAMAATLVRWRVDLALLKGFVQSPIVGPGLGYFVGALSIVEGAVSMRDALRTGDGWTFISGGFQFMSGALIIAGLFWTSPGLQLAGVVVGVAAAAVGLIEEAVKDKMVQFLEVLIAQIKAAKSTFDGSLLMKNIGINYMIDNIERYIPACKVTEIPCDTSWRGNAGESLGRWNIDSALEMLGIHDPALHSRLITNVSP